MKRPQRDWRLAGGEPPSGFAPGLGPLLRRVLWSRDLRESAAVQAYLHAEDESPTDPASMLGLDTAVELVLSALRRGDRIAIFGDYDADGLCATALLQRALRAAGGDVISFIPNRLSEGYGLSADGLRELWGRGASLVVSCDCGTNSVEVVAERPSGMRLIVTDHHLPAARIAEPDALLNPHQPGCPYPSKELSGAGVAYKLVEALTRVLPGTIDIDESLQLVAIAAIADSVPLTRENRRLVRRGLEVISARPLPGLEALIETAAVRRPLGAAAVAFQLAPRLNAAGRMDDARLALELLLASDRELAEPMATALERHNLARREATEKAVSEAEQQLQESAPDGAIVLADPSWSIGLVGLIAGRLAESYHLPAFIIEEGQDECRGSARSVHGYNVVAALTGAERHLLRYGGHAMAAGFSCRRELLGRVRESLVAHALERMPEGGWTRLMPIDAEVPFRELTPRSVRELQALEPCGEGNPAALFRARDVEVRATNVFGPQRDHLSLWLRQADGVPLETIAWRRADLLRFFPTGRRLDVLFTVEASSWDGDERVRLELRDVRAAGRSEPRWTSPEVGDSLSLGAPAVS